MDKVLQYRHRKRREIGHQAKEQAQQPTGFPAAPLPGYLPAGKGKGKQCEGNLYHHTQKDACIVPAQESSQTEQGAIHKGQK